MELGAVLKLHGTLLINEATADAVGAKAPLHATVSRIVKAGGGVGLPPYVEESLRKVVDGRVLIIVGYSGADDIDVMPSLCDIVVDFGLLNERNQIANQFRTEQIHWRSGKLHEQNSRS